MEREQKESPKQFGLPLSVVGPVDVGRLIRELEAADNALLEEKLRKQDQAAPTTSRSMTDTLDQNKLDLLKEADRAYLKKALQAVHDKAPVLHISFSAEPSPEFTQNVMAWLRRELSPTILMTIGLQPNLAAGCIIRSTNHYFDCSLRHDFLNKRGLLVEAIQESMKKTDDAPEPVPEPAP